MKVHGLKSMSKITRMNITINTSDFFSPNWPTGLIRSSIRDVCLLFSPFYVIFLGVEVKRVRMWNVAIYIILINSGERNHHYL